MPQKIDINWIPLPRYWEDWIFLGNQAAYRIAEQIAGIDYLLDLKEKLPQYKLIQKIHEKVILISLGALFEYCLKISTLFRAEAEKRKTKIIKTFNTEKEEKKLSDEGMESAINRLHEAGLIPDDWSDFLHRVRVLRDEVHMDRQRDENIQLWLDEIGVRGIRNRIDDFKSLIFNIVNN